MFRALRWRLTALLVGMLAVLVIVLGVVLNVVVGQVLYTEELKSFDAQSRLTVARQQSRFNTLVQGRTLTGSASASGTIRCVEPLSYQQAFAEAIATPLAYQRGYQNAYLLDYFGKVLVATDDSTASVGAVAPYVTQSELDQLHSGIGTKTAVNGLLGDIFYRTAQPTGQRLGVVLVAERFRTASSCTSPQTTSIIGIVEIVTNFKETQATLAVLRLVVILAVVGMFILALLVGGPLIGRGLAPLTQMTAVARRIASGDLSQRVRLPHGGDEIGQLADAFDEMIARIEQAFGVQARSEARMRQFIADASHELRTPLTAIRGYSDVLLRGAAKDDPAAAEQVLLATRREAERMSRLLNDLLTLARLDEGRPLERQPIDLIALAGEAVDQARMLAGQRDVALTTDGGGRLILPVDPDRLKQVLLILLDNALKYGRPEPEGWVRVRVGRSDRAAVVSVTDNGRGIDPEDLPHIFDRFYRGERAARQRRITGSQVASRPAEPPARPADESHGANDASSRGPTGSGLGLSIARAIVQAHSGTLTVESTLGLGTTFTVALPRS
jgi:signal transduction histidine kinase